MELLIGEIIQANVSPETWSWLLEMKNKGYGAGGFSRAFSLVPSRTGKSAIVVTGLQNERIQHKCAGFSITGWSIDRLCRVWLLLNLDIADKSIYFNSIERLFISAEMGELVALYSALPVLPFPDLWKERCAEGIRSNIGFVLEAIMYGNPYPSQHLDLPAWNQMILKAFFTNKRVHDIVGLDRRANGVLAATLSDYANERWAAGRNVPPMLWRLVGPFIDDKLFSGIKKALSGEDIRERKAAALAIAMSDFQPAKDLLNKTPELKDLVQCNGLTWLDIAGD